MSSSIYYSEYQDLLTQKDALVNKIISFNTLFDKFKFIMIWYGREDTIKLIEVRDTSGNIISTNQDEVNIWTDRINIINAYLTELSMTNDEYLDIITKVDGIDQMVSKGTIHQANYQSSLTDLENQIDNKLAQLNSALYSENQFTI